LPYSREACGAEHWRRVIQSCFPGFEVRSISYLAEGWSSTVWEVNGSHVFRFPKRPEINPGLCKEIRLLPGLAPALPLPIPQFDFVWQGGPEYEGVFVGYPKLPGVELLPEDGALLSRLEDGEMQQRSRPKDGETSPVAQVPRQLGEFLTSLHRFPLSRAIALGISSGDGASWREEYQTLFATVQQRVLPLLDEPTQDNLSRVWREFVDDPANFQFQPALIHRDLCGEHILAEPKARCSSDLFDPGLGRITGIIDWEDAAIGDPAFDFTGLLDFGQEFVQGVWAAYRGPRDGGMLDRARFYRAIVPCHEALFGLECGLPQHISAGLKELGDRFGPPRGDTEYLGPKGA
jgi:aminoglycoside 2''-phosphotransferase